MEKVRKNVKEIMEELNRLSEKDYRTFELALVLFLRSDVFNLDNYITDSDLEKIDNLVWDFDSLLNEDLKENVDCILESEC